MVLVAAAAAVVRVPAAAAAAVVIVVVVLVLAAAAAAAGDVEVAGRGLLRELRVELKLNCSKLSKNVSRQSEYIIVIIIIIGKDKTSVKF